MINLISKPSRMSSSIAFNLKITTHIFIGCDVARGKEGVKARQTDHTPQSYEANHCLYYGELYVKVKNGLMT